MDVSTGIVKTFNPGLAKETQKKCCEENGYPHFAPHDGYCYSCKNNIYTELDKVTHKTGISVESAKGLITGCPHCNASYCD